VDPFDGEQFIENGQPLKSWARIRKKAALRWQHASTRPGSTGKMTKILVMLKGNRNLVGGFKHFLFSIIYGIILPID
jgi:hypothetical protein